jgi:hypothetical protein
VRTPFELLEPSPATRGPGGEGDALNRRRDDELGPAPAELEPAPAERVFTSGEGPGVSGWKAGAALSSGDGGGSKRERFCRNYHVASSSHTRLLLLLTVTHDLLMAVTSCYTRV